MLRRKAVESLDLDSALQRRDADRERRSETKLAIPKGTSGNTYLLDDRRLLDADDTLYRPDVLAQDASVVFADWPSRNEKDT